MSAQDKGYDLYSLTRILSVHATPRDENAKTPTEPSSKPSGIAGVFSKILPGDKDSQTTGPPSERFVTLTHVAQGGYKGQEFLAAFTSNNFLIFRYVGDSGIPLVKQIPWYKETNMKFMWMSFNKSGQWCMCVTRDLTIVLIPIYFIMVKQTMTDQTDAGAFQIIKSAKHKTIDKARKVTDCVWWHSNTGHDFGIISSESGTIRFVNLSTGEVTRIKCKHQVLKLDLVADPDKQFTYLILQMGQGGGYWRLLIEQKEGSGYETIFNQMPNHPSFTPAPLPRFTKPNIKLRAQMTEKGPILAVYNTTSFEFEVYDIRMKSYPMYRYKLFNGNAQLVQLTDKILLVFYLDESQSLRISVVSRLLTEAKGDQGSSQQFRQEATLQEFQLFPGEMARGFLRGFLNPATHRTDAASGAHDEEQQPPSAGNVASPPLEGFFVWTSNAIYELKQTRRPEEIFFRFVALGLERTKAEPLGLTFGLDLLRMYEMAADYYFAAGVYARALDLYFMSNVKTTKLVQQFLQVGRVDVVVTRLKTALETPRDFSLAEKKKLSNDLLRCYIHKALSARFVVTQSAPPSASLPPLKSSTSTLPSTDRTTAISDFEPDEEFETFLRSNDDYDKQVALTMFMQNGMMYYYLVVAQSKNFMTRALQLMLTERGSIFLSDTLIEWLRDNNFSEDLKSIGNGALISHLPPQRQLRLYLEDVPTCHKHLHHIQRLLPLLDHASVVQVCRFLDPLQYGDKIPLQSLQNQPRKVPLDLSDPPTGVNVAQTLQVFVAAVLTLQRRKARRKAETKRRASVAGAAPGADSPNSKSSYHEIRGVHSIPIQAVSCGYNHSAAIAESTSAMYTWGINNKSQLGHGSEMEYKALPKLVSRFSQVKIRQVACGGGHTAAIDSSFALWTWGDGSFGQLCQGDETGLLAPRRVPDLKEAVKFVACGFFHTAAIIDTRLYTCGQGIGGQLGHGDKDSKRMLTLVDKIPPSTRIARAKCGYAHTVALTEKGEVYSTGINMNGQLGLGHKTEQVYVPQVVAALSGKKVIDIDCGAFHTIARTENKQLYWWGRSLKNSRASTRSMPRTMDGDDPADVATPKLISDLQNISCVMMAAGASHNLFLSENGDLIAWGGAVFNARFVKRLSDDPNSPVLITTITKGAKGVRDLSCGDNYAMIVTDTGAVYSIGMGEYGQLGTGTSTNQPAFVPVYFDIFQRREQVLASRDHVYESQKLLLDTLKGHSKQWNPKAMLSLCLSHKHLASASLVCELIGAHVAALTHRLDNIKPTDSSQELSDYLILQIDYVCKLEESSTSKTQIKRDEMLFLILERWQQLKLPTKDLEDNLFSHPETFAILGAILERNVNRDKPFGGVQFSASFLMLVTEYCLKQNAEKYQTLQADKVSEDRLWSQVRLNLEKNIDKKGKVSLSQVQLRDYTKQNPASSQDIAFTCGHFYPKPTFESEILPKLKEKVGAFPFPIPLTTSLALAGYAQPFTSLACPVCVYNYFRDRQNQLQSKVVLDKWTL